VIRVTILVRVSVRVRVDLRVIDYVRPRDSTPVGLIPLYGVRPAIAVSVNVRPGEGVIGPLIRVRNWKQLHARVWGGRRTDGMVLEIPVHRLANAIGGIRVLANPLRQGRTLQIRGKAVAKGIAAIRVDTSRNPRRTTIRLRNHTFLDT
jgi:hypothetical protein